MPSSPACRHASDMFGPTDFARDGHVDSIAIFGPLTF